MFFEMFFLIDLIAIFRIKSYEDFDTGMDVFKLH
jgi:hypothetical protein